MTVRLDWVAEIGGGPPADQDRWQLVAEEVYGSTAGRVHLQQHAAAWRIVWASPRMPVEPPPDATLPRSVELKVELLRAFVRAELPVEA